MKDYPELEPALNPPLPESKNFEIVNVLKSGNDELKKLAGSIGLDKTYAKDSALSEKSKLAAAESAPSTSYLMNYAST